ncbi:RluA family pseudouridine synthase [Flavisolibacter ginsenosidimutans]|uniref:Pseudouridine synthase n=1 Tax=Flavisolibacter ginsenosidimutans TaxID=661481 RepID=A0A5B8UEA3_9BACT|nr:RluA family pseudouridine synthase [Flavisolibacter ginsenosidimutans]QEC54752.1 RluA family pseudouridine synthase [Flavisolibacter ginsenosidimutans]
MSFMIADHIVFQNEDFVAINKPSGLLTIPDREGKELSLKSILKERFGEIFTVHRLDRDTSGLVVFALNEAAHKHLSQQFEARETDKIYNGLVLGKLISEEGVINEPIAEHPTKRGLMTVWRKGKESVTEYKVLESFRLYSLVQFKILTGRTHQIRVHMKHIGHPIACDASYGDGKPILLSQLKTKFKLSQADEEERPLLNRLALHSSQLSFHGINNDHFSLQAPLPKDFRATINQLQKAKR